MIIIKVKGGMGNQLFQYALYCQLRHMKKTSYVDLSYYRKDKPHCKYGLDTLGLQPEEAAEEAIRKLTGGEGLANKIWRRLRLRPSYFRERNLLFDKSVFSRDNVYLNGYWQSDKYFPDIKSVLRREIHYPSDGLRKNGNLYEKITSMESVCVTIRRGDYLTKTKNKKAYFVCDEKYFTQAMKKIQQDLKAPVFFAFSDDIEWVRENIRFPGEVYYESGDDAVAEKLRLMSACKHFIISNSSFSWWAQYLSDNEQKLVYAPKQWYADGRKTDIYQENWHYV